MNKVQKVIEGLTILNTYKGCAIQAEHDVLFAGPDTEVSESDARLLEGLGWTYVASEKVWKIYA